MREKHSDVVKDTHFEEIDQVKVDSKSRITLRKKSGAATVTLYKVYKNALGQIVLDPQVTIPAYEEWLFKNRIAQDMVLKGLDDAKKGRLVDADEDYSQYVDPK